MAVSVTGVITNQTMAAAMPLMMAGARRTNEQIFNMTGLVEHVRLMQGTGEAWIEPQFNQIDAQYINDNQVWENPQLVEPFREVRIVPVAWGVQMILNDNVRGYMQPKVWAQSLGAGERAIRRFEDKFILQGFNAATNEDDLGGPLDVTKIRVARTNMLFQKGDHAEPPVGMIKLVGNEYQIDDIENQITGNFDNQNFGQMSMGLTQRTFEQGLRANMDYVGRFAGVDVHRNNHIRISNNEASALMFTKMSGIYVSHNIRQYEVQRLATRGEGAELMIRRHKAGFGLRRPDIHSRRLKTDATTPS